MPALRPRVRIQWSCLLEQRTRRRGRVRVGKNGVDGKAGPCIKMRLCPHKHAGAFSASVSGMKLNVIRFVAAIIPGLLYAPPSYGQARSTPPIVLDRGVQAPAIKS